MIMRRILRFVEPVLLTNEVAEVVRHTWEQLPLFIWQPYSP